MLKVSSLQQEVERHPYHQRQGVQGQKACKHTLLCFLTVLCAVLSHSVVSDSSQPRGL